MSAPPKGWKPPRSPGETFFCAQLSCSLPARDCCRRLYKRVNGTSEPFFPYCHEGCEQGMRVVKSTGYVHHGNRQKGGMSEEEFSAHLSRRTGRRGHHVKRLPKSGPPCVICGGDGCDFCLE